MATVPLVLTYHSTYKTIFSSEWYDIAPRDFWSDRSSWPSPLGLSLGLGAVVVGHIFVLSYFLLFRAGKLGERVANQKVGARPYDLMEGIFTHLAQPEGFVMLGTYLTGTWMFGLMPPSYYSFSGNVNWYHVAAQLLIQDFVQYLMHHMEHYFRVIQPPLYIATHKPHHKFLNPRFFDAFNGSPADTFLMILIPLYITALIVPANVWSYMAFGSIYANWLTLIHSEYIHPWEFIFKKLGMGTSGDHHVHHALFEYNFGHLFMYWDMVFGTYKNTTSIEKFSDYVKS